MANFGARLDYPLPDREIARRRALAAQPVRPLALQSAVAKLIVRTMRALFGAQLVTGDRS
jgi:hypothetical protein